MNGNFGPVRLVAGREIHTRLRTKAFRISTVVMLVVIVGFIVAVKLIGESSGRSVGFVSSTQVLAEPLKSAAEAVGQTVTPSVVTEADGEAKLQSNDLDALVVGTPTDFQIIVRRDLNPSLRNAFQVLVRQIAMNGVLVRAGVDPAAVADAVKNATVNVKPLEPVEPYRTERILLGVIAGVLVYVSLLIYGQAVAQGVVEEKSNRIVELLLSTIKPWQLMLGKVGGIGVVGLIQMLLAAGAGLAAGLATGAFQFPRSIATEAAIWIVVWFILGYLMYATLFASLAALVSRQEDVAAVVTTPMMLIVLPYVLGVSIIPSNPDNKFMEILSMIPFFSPTLMPIRQALGVADTWQIVMSVGLSVVLIVGLIWLSGRIYRGAVLRVGSRVSLRSALRGHA